jgi:hypothetical protein
MAIEMFVLSDRKLSCVCVSAIRSIVHLLSRGGIKTMDERHVDADFYFLR